MVEGNQQLREVMKDKTIYDRYEWRLMIRIDTAAAEMIPIRLLLSVAIISVISFLTFAGFQQIQSAGEIDSFEKDLLMLKVELSTLYATGAPRDLRDPFAPVGTSRIFSFYIPSTVTVLRFGSNQFADPLKLGYDEKSTSGIFYEMISGSEQVIWCDTLIHFLKGTLQDSRWISSDDPIIFYMSGGGRLDATFELVLYDDDVCVLIYPVII
jgi:hypothetical protein